MYAQNASPDVIKVLAGNKCDNDSLRAVDKADGEKVSTYIIIILYYFTHVRRAFSIDRDFIIYVPGKIRVRLDK